MYQVNIDKLEELIRKDFGDGAGKYQKAAQALNVNESTLFRIRRGTAEPGARFILALHGHLQKTGRDISDYLTKSN